MARLARLRFVSIGHPNARCDDLTLSFLDAEGAPTDTTVWLRNGGGKSQTLTLFYSLVRPRKREFLGHTVDGTPRQLSDYVLKDDAALVIAEWQLDSSQPALLPLQERLITGVFYERGEIATETDEGERRIEIDKCFFALRSIPTDSETSLDNLPVYETNGRRQRRRLKQFRRALEGIRDRTPAAQVTVTREVTEWEDVLRSYALDPELFQYQVRMNAAESGASRIFHDRRTVRDFIDLFLEILVDRDFGERIRSHLEQHRTHLRRRLLELEPGLALVDQVRPLAAQFSTLHEQRTLVRADGERIRATSELLSTHGSKRRVDLEAQIASQQGQAEEAAQSARARRQEAHQHRLSATALKRDLAILAARTEAVIVTQLETQLSEATRERDLWDCAIVLRDHDHHVAEAQEHRRALERREAAARPLLQAVQSVADDYAAALHAQIHGFEQSRTQTESDKSRAIESESRARSDHVAAMSRQSVAREAASTARRNAEAMDRDRTRLISARVLEIDETPTAGVRRLTDALALLDEQIASRAVLIRSLEASQRSAADKVAQADKECLAALQALDVTRRRLADAERQGRELATDEKLLTLLELESVDLSQLDNQAVQLIRDHTGREMERLLLARMELAQRNRDLGALDTTGLLPDSPDVARVLEHLRSHRVVAHSGWQYLAETTRPHIARSLLQVMPDIASAVVIRDDDFDAATKALTGAAVDVDSPVPIRRQTAVAKLAAEGASGPMPRPDHVVLPVRDLHFDRAAGRAFVPELRARVEESQTAVDSADRERRALDLLHVRLTSFLSVYGPEWFVTERLERQRLEEALAGAQSAVDKLRRDLSVTERDVASARDEERLAQSQRSDLQHSRQRLDDFIARWGKQLSEYAARIQETEATVSAATTEAQQASKRIETHARERQDAEARLLQLAERIAALKQQASVVKYARSDVSPRSGDAIALRQLYDAKLAEYEGKVGRDTSLRLAEQAERNAEVQLQRLTQKRKSIPIEDIRSKLATIPDPSLAEDRHAAADDFHKRSFGLYGNRSQSYQRLEATARVVIDESTKVGLISVDFATRMAELPPDDGALTPRLADEQRLLERMTAESEAEANDLEQLAQLANNRLAQSRSSLSAVAAAIRMLDVVVRPATQLLQHFAGSVSTPGLVAPASDDAFVDAVPALGEGLSALREQWEKLDSDQRRTTSRMRALLAKPEYVHLEDAMFRRLASVEGDELEAHAGEVESELKLRREHLAQAIADLDRHMNDLVQLTLAAADEGRRLLRLATLRSELPPHVPAPLGGRAFLKISHVEPSTDVDADRAAAKRLVEGWVRSDKNLPPALGLLQEAVHTVSPRIHAQILFPDAAKQQVRMDPISALGTYSGGEKLTAATLIYCILARVRAQKSGSSGYGTNVLLCDNPQGQASLPTLLTWQRDVAGALGVQLIYFTGIEDLEAIRVMPNTVRIENSRYDARTNQQVLEVASSGSPTLAALRLVRSESEYPTLATKPPA